MRLELLMPPLRFTIVWFSNVSWKLKISSKRTEKFSPVVSLNSTNLILTCASYIWVILSSKINYPSIYMLQELAILLNMISE